MRSLYAILVAGFAAITAQAHFVFIVPAKDGATAVVVLSEELAPDEAVDVARLSGARLFVRDAAGKDQPVERATDKHALTAKLPGSGPRLVFGSVAYGVIQRGEGKPYLLTYHPKAVLGNVPAAKLSIGDAVPVELIPRIESGAIRFQLLAAGKPVPESEVTVLKPDGAKAKLKTAKDGLTEPVIGTGRYGAWARFFQPKSGELGGKKYDEIRHYPTIVVDVAATTFPPLPKAASSIGAIECDGFLYIYGGHVGKTHHYDAMSIAGDFYRLNLNGGTKWEKLPGGPILQGMNLAAHGGKVYRVGGMQPRNAPGEAADNHSVADVARFDPQTKKWEAMPPLPAGRSSHDVVVAGDKLVVVGGWNQRGKGHKSEWHDTAVVMDLAASRPEWTTIPQPFKRRALTAATVGSKVYVLAGLGEKATEQRTDILDLATGLWTSGPAIPGSGRVGFAPAAGVAGGRVLLNTFDGSVYRLTPTGDGWEKVGTAAHKRMVGRLIPRGKNAVILVGGANGTGNVGEVELVEIATKGEPPTARR